MNNKIMQIIQTNNLKVKDVIERANVSKTYFYDVVNGKSIPSVKKAADIAKALGVSIDYLFF